LFKQLNAYVVLNAESSTATDDVLVKANAAAVNEAQLANAEAPMEVTPAGI
jgi:hypothetical protein